MTADDLVERELVWNRFRRLILEVLRGGTRRNVFQHWEMDLLVDIEGCVLDPKRKAATLRQYVRAVERQLETKSGPPMNLSEFLRQRAERRKPG